MRIREQLDMTRRHALVTGGAGHLGRAAVEVFAELGADVTIVDIDPEMCDSVASDVSDAFGTRAHVLARDLSDDAGIPDLVEEAVATAGRLDVLVNCAAFVGTSDLVGWATDLGRQSSEVFERALAVNLVAPFSLTKAAAQHLRRSPCGGSVINVSSIYGHLGPDMRLYEDLEMGNPAAYSSSKGGLEQLTRWFCTVLAPDVRVNAIAPGGIERGQPQYFIDRYVERTPMRRMATEDDLRGAFAYLGSDLSRYTTGQILTVDGGWSAW